MSDDADIIAWVHAGSKTWEVAEERGWNWKELLV